MPQYTSVNAFFVIKGAFTSRFSSWDEFHPGMSLSLSLVKVHLVFTCFRPDEIAFKTGIKFHPRAKL